MIWKTHAMFGVAAVTAPSYVLLEKYPEKYAEFLQLNASTIEIIGNPVLFIFTLMFFSWLGSFVPDLDHEGSYISKRLKPISIFTKHLKHRGSTHSLIVAIIVSILITAPIIYFSGMNYDLSIYGVAFLLGWISHLVGDCLTKSGLKHVFFPIYNNKKGLKLLPKFLLVTTNGFGEYIVYLVPLTVFNAYFIYYILA